MIYLTEGNTPLNEAYNDEIVQERNNTYQLTFRFPTSDPKWELLKEETFLTADDLHGEQDFYIFEVEKQQGYIQVYANQVISLLNNYIVSSIDVDRVSGTRALSALAGSITRANPFSFFSDIDDRHTLNIKDKNAMEVLAKDKHSILGQWGGDMVRNGYNLRLLKNGGSENESLFMYKKNLSSYQHKTSTKSLKTRITFKTTVKGEGEKAPDVDYVVVIDSPLLGKYSQIYEAVVEVNDQNVKDQASLIEYGKQYFRTSMCDMLEDNLEISVVGQSDVAVRMFDVVSIYHEWYGLDVRKKITKYTYSPMAKRLKSIGFGTFQSSLANAIGGIVNDAVLNESRNLHQIFEERLKKEIANADRAFDAEFAKREKDITDAIELTKAKAEEVKQDISNEIDKRFQNFDNASIQEARRKAEEALRNAGASSSLAQEAKRIGLDSVARLEAFKSQTTSAQTALSGDLDALKQTIANDIRPKQAQAEAEIAKQVEALNKTKNELAGIKSAQATYEETTTRRLSELTNLANGKASKSELRQTAEQLASRIASVQASGRNLFLNSLFKQDISKTGIWTTSTYEATIDSTDKYLGHNALKIVGQNPSGRDGSNSKITYPALGQFGKVIAGSMTNQDVTITFYAKANKNGIMLKSRLGYIGYKTGNVTLSTEIKRYVVHIPKNWTNESNQTTNEWLFNFNQEGTVWIWMPKFEISDVDTSYSEAPEDTDGQISAVESSFKQRADALDADVRSLTEGLRTKADISSLNVTAENIRQSVKSLETDTQNKLNQKLSLAEFEVRAGSIRQEILNATKDKADKTLVVAEAGKLREEFSKIKVGSRNYAEDYDFSRGLWHYNQGDNSPQDWTISNGEYNVKGTTKTWKQFQIHSKEGSQASGKSSTALLDLEIGETYTLSFQGICYSGSSSVWLSLRANRTVSGNPEIMSGTFNLTSSWQNYQVTIPALTKPDNFDFWRIILGYNEIGHVAFRKVELTRSSTRIDAGPAPEDGKADLVVAKSEFQKTAEGLSAKMTAVERYVNQDGQRQEALQRYAREESAKQATAVREQISKDYVGKNTFQESVQGVERRLESLSLGTSGNLLKNSNDGFYNQHDKRYRLAETLQANQTYTLVSKYWHGENSTDHTFYNGVGKWQRLSYNKAIDAWMVQFTPTQEIPAGTEIILSAVPNDAKGNMSWATLVRGAIPLIHWQPAKGDVEEGVTQKLAEYKETVDGRFATISSQINGKANQSDFQRVKETSQLYERIIGSNENDISNKVARMALTNQLFQVEVGKYSGNGVNRAVNTTSDWGPFTSRSGNDGVNLHTDLHKILSSGFKAGDNIHVRMEVSIDGVQRFNDKQIVAILQSYGDVTNWARAGRTFDYNIGTLQPGNNWRLIEFDTVMTEEMLKNNSWMLNLRVDGASSYKVHTKSVKVEKGNVASAWSPAPEDTEEAVRTVQRQLAGSWAVQNLTSAGALVSGLNLGANGHNRLDGQLTHITGETLIDRAVIKSAMVDKLKTANFEAGSVTTKILDAEAVTADKVRFDNAFIRKMLANEAFIDQLTSKRIFATKVESVVSSSTFLEAYQGRIGGFTLGQFDQGGGRWISGVNQFSVGMGNGAGYGVRTAFWANWGNNWNYAGPKAWNVNTDGKMYCRNEVGFYDQVDFSNSSSAQFYGSTYFRYSPRFTNGIHMHDQDILGNGGSPRNSGQNAVVWWNQVGEGTVKYWMDQRSDKRLKENITDTAVKALDKINRLNMVAFDFIESKKHEEIGLIAQEVETIVPRVVSRDPENPDGYLHIDYTAFVPYLIKAIQELNQKIEKMEKTIA